MNAARPAVVVLIAWGVADGVVMSARFCGLGKGGRQVVGAVKGAAASSVSNFLFRHESGVQGVIGANPGHAGHDCAANIYWIDRDLSPSQGIGRFFDFIVDVHGFYPCI